MASRSRLSPSSPAGAVRRTPSGARAGRRVRRAGGPSCPGKRPLSRGCVLCTAPSSAAAACGLRSARRTPRHPRFVPRPGARRPLRLKSRRVRGHGAAASRSHRCPGARGRGRGQGGPRGGQLLAGSERGRGGWRSARPVAGGARAGRAERGPRPIQIRGGRVRVGARRPPALPGRAGVRGARLLSPPARSRRAGREKGRTATSASGPRRPPASAPSRATPSAREAAGAGRLGLPNVRPGPSPRPAAQAPPRPSSVPHPGPARRVGRESRRRSQAPRAYLSADRRALRPDRGPGSGARSRRWLRGGGGPGGAGGGRRGEGAAGWAARRPELAQLPALAAEGAACSARRMPSLTPLARPAAPGPPAPRRRPRPRPRPRPARPVSLTRRAFPRGAPAPLAPGAAHASRVCIRSHARSDTDPFPPAPSQLLSHPLSRRIAATLCLLAPHQPARRSPGRRLGSDVVTADTCCRRGTPTPGSANSAPRPVDGGEMLPLWGACSALRC